MLNQIADLINLILTHIITGFEEKWNAVLLAPTPISQISSPFRFGETKEHYDLLNYCTKYGKASWPLVLDIAKRNVSIVSYENEAIEDKKINLPS